MDGFSIDLWASIETELHATHEFSVTESVNDLLGAVQSGKADLGIAAVSITSDRNVGFDFSQPMFDAGLQIMVRDTPGGGSNPSFLSILFSPIFLQLVWIILFGYVVFGDFPDRWTLLGIVVIVSSGLYVAYGERVHFRQVQRPNTKLGY